MRAVDFKVTMVIRGSIQQSVVDGVSGAEARFAGCCVRRAEARRFHGSARCAVAAGEEAVETPALLL